MVQFFSEFVFHITLHYITLHYITLHYITLHKYIFIIVIIVDVYRKEHRRCLYSAFYK